VGLTRAERTAAIVNLDRIRDEIAWAATWLSQHDADEVAISLESAYYAIGSAIWDLDRDNHAAPSRPEGWLNGASRLRT